MRSAGGTTGRGSPADAGLPGLHGWAFWGAGAHPRRYVLRWSPRAPVQSGNAVLARVPALPFCDIVTSVL